VTLTLSFCLSIMFFSILSHNLVLSDAGPRFFSNGERNFLFQSCGMASSILPPEVRS
jgi:hypothetical protein